MTSDREQFGRDELAIVLSHYNLGVLEGIREFPKGSRKAPKLVLKTERGMFLLKRRARGKDDPYKVAFSHALQLHLASQNFPLPHLIGTTKDNNSMLQYDGTIYEIFEYIPGDPYDLSLESTFDSGKTLGVYHKLLAEFNSQWTPPKGSYHDADACRKGFRHAPRTLGRMPGNESQLGRIDAAIKGLADAYEHACAHVVAERMADWPEQITHSDWHPGNMLFRQQRVVAVIDYDSARFQQRVTDVANGLLQFSILGGNDDPSTWPDYFDDARMKRFLMGYDASNLITQAELKVIPWLMIEALIAEAVLPIASSGFFGRIAGLPFCEMIVRKVAWLREHHQDISQLIA